MPHSTFLQKKKAIDEIYRIYLNKLSDLQKQQNKILQEFSRALEREKIEQMREKINRIKF